MSPARRASFDFAQAVPSPVAATGRDDEVLVALGFPASRQLAVAGKDRPLGPDLGRDPR